MADAEGGSEETYPGTVPLDPRFPNTNCTRYCFVMFSDYHRCIRLYNEGHEDCSYFKKAYETLCPNFWVEKFEQQVEEGTFPLPLPKKKEEGQDAEKK
ncbi:uncharacterized protein [Onthophagus taurus]|uniref:uncharacterized protein n=1 Tax=Onthophagus taurus TaxID=166361 RepID=UPI000C20440F|nr:cytochrome c oxidase subunit 6b-2-like [Onthophagus taurus]